MTLCPRTLVRKSLPCLRTRLTWCSFMVLFLCNQRKNMVSPFDGYIPIQGKTNMVAQTVGSVGFPATRAGGEVLTRKRGQALPCIYG